MSKLISSVKSAYDRFLDIDHATDLFGHFIWVQRYTTGIGLHANDGLIKILRIFFLTLSAIFSLQLIVIVQDMVEALRTASDDRGVRIGTFVMYSLLSIAKMIVLDVNYGHFLRIADYLNSRRHRRCGGAKAYEIRRESFRVTQRNLLVALIPVNLVSLIWAFFGREEYFHFRADFGTDLQWLVNAIDFFYGIPIVFWNHVSFVISLTINSVLRSVLEDLKVIVETFSSVLDRSTDEAERAQGPSLNCEKQFWESFDRNFKAAVSDYQEFLEIVTVLRKLTTLFLLLQVLTTEGLLAVTCFMTFDLTFQGMTALSFAVVFLVECFSLCSTVEALNDQKNVLCESFRHWRWSQWMQHSPEATTRRMRHVRAMVLICTTQGQQRVRIRCGEMLDISMEMFRMVLHTCYSLVMFLQASNDH